ncbi:MAG: cupin domain-containing protein [Clostridiales bacterium]|jgi:transcriptional regulator with XRE-family HTH domain|nr:cupin domain-containing protein [Clostridiales bacterium]
MTEQLKDIGSRLRALREIMEFTPSALAEKMGITEEEYTKYEEGEVDFSFSFLYTAANILGVDVLDLMSGESPKLSSFTIVRAGDGYDISRRKAYNYKHLAYTFRNKKAEPFLVSVEPNSEELVKLHSHEGQEFDYMLTGSMLFYLNDMVTTLNPGDSVYYDSSAPHAMKAAEGTARFLAVVIK